MTLPSVTGLDVPIFAGTLSHTTTSYKFLFLQTLLDETLYAGRTPGRCRLEDLTIGMVVRAWPLIVRLRLSFGAQDQIQKIVEACTPKGVIKMIESIGVGIEGKRAVVLGRSNIVGKPLALMLLQRNATVTICHSKTKDLPAVCREADLLLVAIGKAKFVTADMVKEGAVVIDVGTNRWTDGKLCGDVDYTALLGTAGWITPVPGGVGPMTIAMLIENTVKAAQ